MTIKALSSYNVDILGALASGICLIHCVATPFLFIAHTSMDHELHHNVPIWWQSIDLLFIGLSFLAVYWTVKNTSKNWIKYAFWLAWSVLTFVIINEKLEWLILAESIIYLPALSLVGLHLYNRRYCQCADEACCNRV
ncbi:MerC domain-containing protein [Winogradskyella aurantiaca]|uniref:MerC domain-containing protein n=1 Tax=Winogradskyella aurantiaca TaxID=2219558 RepID=UPI000E1D0D5E|nr:MerC domain-containing protein [Winogradskyella aurantiaca]